MSAVTEARLRDLLVDWALGETLSAAEWGELRALCARHPEIRPEAYEHAAACVHLGLATTKVDALTPAAHVRVEDVRARLLGVAPRGNPWRAGWWVAAAAVVLMWWATFERGARAPQPAANDWARTAWTQTEDRDASGVTGEVVWSPSTNQGWMRFSNLPVNNPSEAQYQLWIFDATRSAEHPIDGGVFDARPGSFEVPIDPKLTVDQATLFAITLERPGGVVVSSRERLLLTAAL